MNKALIVFFFTCTAFSAFAQISQEEKILQQVREQEQARKSELMRIMDQGVDSMNVGNYNVAENMFKNVLKKAKVVPTDLCFYLGKNSFYIEKYQQSIDWLSKYIQIKGTSGRFYKEAIDYLDKSKAKFLVVREGDQVEARNILSNNYDVDCGPYNKVICPVCQGEGVIIEQGAFGKTYKECPYSDEHGYLTCEQYNQLLRGELEARK